MTATFLASMATPAPGRHQGCVSAGAARGLQSVSGQHACAGEKHGNLVADELGQSCVVLNFGPAVHLDHHDRLLGFQGVPGFFELNELDAQLGITERASSCRAVRERANAFGERGGGSC